MNNNMSGDAPSPKWSHKSVYDWHQEKTEKAKTSVYDDGTMTFFWRAHTLTVLFLLVCGLIYVALLEPIVHDENYNIKRGLVACVLVFLLLGVTVTHDGPFKRPHPALWRFTFCCSILYELALIFLLFQTPEDARKMLKHIDPKLGEPLEERSYGGNCLIYDTDVPNDPFHNIWDKFDIFVVTHFLGWWLKTFVLRDLWLSWVISIMFEILEYTLAHQLPNFSECWWDHWIMDVLICNGLGIYIGLLTIRYYSVKTYHWRGLWNISSYSGKLKRILAQFGPYSWIEFQWKPTSSLGRWLSTLGIITLFLLAELGTFYLKFALWIPPEHIINAIRLFGLVFWGAVAIRETFQYLDDPDCTQFGRQSWMFIAIMATEVLLVSKFAWDTVTKPFPRHIEISWVIGLGLLAAWTVWEFFISERSTKKKEVEQRRHWWKIAEPSPIHSELNGTASAVKSHRN